MKLKMAQTQGQQLLQIYKSSQGWIAIVFRIHKGP